ncbi:hypothetical protein BaRGS_00016158 [Batillaria attramentaria]|uniref:Structural maintenance of chromosomes protein 5 n=1 Tax=Batillaria attramentaria TaxID=370345 RepID=A0ABD0KZS9_9CAEN
MHQEKRRALAPTNNHMPNSKGDAATNKKSRVVDRTPDGTFKEGAIVRIMLQNVLTYDSVEFRTGPYLNVIIGPNGTGKSAIVCAICLGLAGKTSWLGRASSPADFIKYGHNKGIIELELHNATGENYIIRREIIKHKTNDKVQSSWSVNGRGATQKTVEEMAARLNIQVGNLVQFLPQEKVADFARMSQVELLQNTEKAVGTTEMYELHERLISMCNDTQDNDQGLAALRDQLDTEQQKNARLEQDVKNFEQREKFLQRVQLLKMKRPWMEYLELKHQFEQAKKDRDDKQAALNRAKGSQAPLQNRVDAMTESKQNIEAQLKHKTSEIRDHANKVSECSRNLDDLTDKISDAKNDLELKQREEESRLRKLADLTSQLTALENEYSQLEGADAERLAAELQEVNDTSRDLMKQMNAIHNEGMQLQSQVTNLRRQIAEAQQELRNIQDVGKIRLEQLRRRHKHTYDAVMWLRQNRDKFKSTIYEPMLLCLNMKNPADAKYVETHISERDMRAFVFEDPDDLDKFMEIMQEQRLKVNTVKVPPQPLSSFKPKYPIDHIRRYGFQSYLSDLFTCPDAVMAYLCCLYRVHQIPVGDQNTRRNVEHVIQDHPDITMFYTPDVQYSLKKSRYDNAVSSRNTPLKEASFLVASKDLQREEELLRAIKDVQRTLTEKEDNYRELQRTEAVREKELNEARERKKELMRQKDAKKRVQQQIETKRKSIQRVEGERVDLPLEERKFQDKISSIINKKCEHLVTMHLQTQRCFELSKEKVRMSLKQAETLKELSALEAQLRDATQGLATLEREVEDLKNHVKQAFENCPDTIAELDDEIHQKQARADSIFQTDETVIQNYRQRERRIAELKEQLARREVEQGLLRKDLDDARTKWLTPLKELIAKINDKFGEFFSAMDCSGEVDLYIPENEDQFDKYGIRIRVKFRDGEQLRELTPFHQSGGERSVATVLYMMALQELAKCPFRCVDEINQGMDPVNERKVFELVLLPDLEYADNMTVLCVNNGPHVLSHREWDLAKFIQLGAALSQSD